MRSTFIGQDVRIEDREGLNKMFEEMDEDGYMDGLLENGELCFSAWDDMKIEGYWYPEFLVVLKELAKYIKGWIQFQYEEGYMFRIYFQDGKPYFSRQPDADWDELDRGEL